MEENVIHTGDCIEQLRELPAESVNMCMTSPPYWNLRDYDHEDQLGLEETAEEYVNDIADVFDEVERVLRPDGSLWLNLGDTYDDKDLQQIPARVALELQNRGWILRNRVTWAKPNPMPHSVKDRLNGRTEAVFHFVKGREYWYDLDAIREPHAKSSHERDRYGGKRNYASEDYGDGTDPMGGGANEDMNLHTAGKNPGDVFEVTTKPFPDAHFAVYPPELVEKPLKATCPPKVCAECGSPYERDVDVERENYGNRADRVEATGGAISGGTGKNFPDVNRDFKGWQQNCDCDTDAIEPGIALDPFAGAGTTLLKAKELGRKFVGIEINPEYADMARARVGLAPHDPANIRDDDDQQGLEVYADGGGNQ